MSERVFRLVDLGGRYGLIYTSSLLDNTVVKVAIIKKDLTEGDIYLPAVNREMAYDSMNIPDRRYPFSHPLDEMLMVNMLARGKGVKIHGLAVDFKGHGIILCGPSGTGKSTMGRLWGRRPDAVVLCTDRPVIRSAGTTGTCGDDDKTGYVIYGTPWRGDKELRAYGGASFDRIILLKQGPENRLVEISPVDAATSLIALSFSTFWDPEGMAFTVDFISRLCEAVPCYELYFRPDEEAVQTAIEGL